jgi:hypothetical protein
MVERATKLFMEKAFEEWKWRSRRRGGDVQRRIFINTGKLMIYVTVECQRERAARIRCSFTTSLPGAPLKVAGAGWRWGAAFRLRR